MIGSLEKAAVSGRYYIYVDLHKEGILYVRERFADDL